MISTSALLHLIVDGEVAPPLHCQRALRPVAEKVLADAVQAAVQPGLVTALIGNQPVGTVRTYLGNA